MWMFWAILAILGFVSSLKSFVERMTWRSIQRGKVRQAGAGNGRPAGYLATADQQRSNVRRPPRLHPDIMPSFHHGPVEIAYFDEGEGEPIVLVHGFASTKEINWVHPGWVATLKGRRVIALDNRGHGASTKLYDPEQYRTSLMADDVRALLDHLGRSSRPT